MRGCLWVTCRPYYNSYGDLKYCLGLLWARQLSLRLTLSQSSLFSTWSINWFLVFFRPFVPRREIVSSLQSWETFPQHFAAGRFIRHFNTLNIDLFAGATVTAIFSRIVLWHLDTKGFSKEFDPCIEQVSRMTAAFYSFTAAVEKVSSAISWTLPWDNKCRAFFSSASDDPERLKL